MSKPECVLNRGKRVILNVRSWATYRPATIFRANLLAGALSPKVDLTPEPERYPAGQRPIGQDSVAMLQGGDALTRR